MIWQKKGDASDPLIMLIMLFFLAVSFLIVIFINTEFSSIIETSALNESAASSSILEGFDNINQKALDRGFALVFALMIIFIFASGFLIRVHPIFLFFYIFFLAITIFAAVPIGNMYVKIQENPTLATVAESASMTNWIMNHIVMIVLAVGIISMILIFSKLFPSPGAPGGDTGDIL